MNVSSRDFWETFPLLTIKDSIIVSKRGDLTVGWTVSLQPTYTIDSQTYSNLNKRFESALRALPPWMIVHRQDIFLKDRYHAESSRGFLDRMYEAHFDRREFLRHEQRIYLTLSSRASALRSVGDCGIFGFKNIVGTVRRQEVDLLKRTASAFAHMINSAEIVNLKRLDDHELLTELEKYMQFSIDKEIPTDRKICEDSVELNGKKIYTYSLSESKDLPYTIGATAKIERLSSNDAEIHLSTGAPIGVLLDCEHIVNSYFLTVPQNEIANELDKSRRHKISMSKRSFENTSNAEELEEFNKDSHEKQLITIKAHNNLVIWANASDIDNATGKAAAALSSMGITCKRNTLDTPVIWYASIPGAATELGKQNFRTAELMSCLCLGINETYQRDIPNGNIKLCDRIRNIPLRIDFQKSAEEHGLISNYNAFILGPSGSGKSFFTNHLTRSLYDAGQSIAIIDMGDSYEGLCNIIKEESEGRDGIYMKWDPEHPISFDAFHGFEDWLKDIGENKPKILQRDHEGVLYLMSIIKYMWSPAKGWLPENEAILGDIIELFARSQEIRKPVFADLYDYIVKKLIPVQEDKGLLDLGDTKIVKQKFDLSDMIQALKSYTRDQTFGFLFNDENPMDIFTSRFTVFEIADLSQKGEKSYYPLVILGMISAFNSIMRKDADTRKVLIIEEAWKAIANKEMSGFLQELWKTSRKYNTSAIVVSQQFSDLLASESVKDTIIQNSGTKILLSQESNMTEIDSIVKYFGLSQQEKAMLMSIGMNMNPDYRYKEAFINIGGKHCSVYATELSPQEGFAYQTNKSDKQPYLKEAAHIGYRAAAEKLAMKENEMQKD